MNNDNLTEMLDKYNRYQKGDESCKCELLIQDESITGYHFDKSELGGSAFLGVTFRICQFSSVYLSLSNFGGSTFEMSMIKSSIMRKAEWNNIKASSLTVNELDTFRSDFIDSNFEKCLFGKSKFFKSNFGGSAFRNVTFFDSHFELASFKDCSFEYVIFKNCTFKNCNLNFEQDGLTFIDCKTV